MKWLLAILVILVMAYFGVDFLSSYFKSREPLPAAQEQRVYQEVANFLQTDQGAMLSGKPEGAGVSVSVNTESKDHIVEPGEFNRYFGNSPEEGIYAQFLQDRKALSLEQSAERFELDQKMALHLQESPRGSVVILGHALKSIPDVYADERQQLMDLYVKATILEIEGDPRSPALKAQWAREILEGTPYPELKQALTSRFPEVQSEK
jgi:hypothetical protein